MTKSKKKAAKSEGVLVDFSNSSDDEVQNEELLASFVSLDMAHDGFGFFASMSEMLDEDAIEDILEDVPEEDREEYIHCAYSSFISLLLSFISEDTDIESEDILLMFHNFLSESLMELSEVVEFLDDEIEDEEN